MQAVSSHEDSCLSRKNQDASRWNRHTAVLPVRDLVLSALFHSLMVNLLCFSYFLKNLSKKTWKIAVDRCKVFTAIRCYDFVLCPSRSYSGPYSQTFLTWPWSLISSAAFLWAYHWKAGEGVQRFISVEDFSAYFKKKTVRSDDLSVVFYVRASCKL